MQALQYHLLKTDLYDKKLVFFAIIDNAFLFVIGLMMENIAASMIVGIVFLLIYSYLYKRQAFKFLIPNFIFSTVSFTIMRMSPGSASRLLREHEGWVKMSFFEKLVNGYPNFLNMTFIKNNYAISLFSICLLMMIFFSKKKNLKKKIVPSIILMMGVVSVFSFVFGDNMLNNQKATHNRFIFNIS